MCWHVKAWACRLLQSHPLSVLPFVLAECCVSSSHNSKFLCLPKIFSISVCVCVCGVFLQRLTLPPTSTVRGILYHVSVVFRELSKKIKHWGLAAPPYFPPPFFFFPSFPLTHSLHVALIVFYSFHLPIFSPASQLLSDRANFIRIL